MKIKPAQLERLAGEILKRYLAKELIRIKRDEAAVKNKVVEIVSRNFVEEEAIEEEARKVLASYGRAAKDMDPYKMFLIAKQKVAAKKGFIL